jgi:hypothetical protein
MTKLKFLVGAAVVFSMLAGLSLVGSPAMARRVYSGPVRQSVYCATREAGNPHSQYCDYIAWSQWRRLGSWDSRLDNACMANPAYIPGECGRNAQGNVLFPPNVY